MHKPGSSAASAASKVRDLFGRDRVSESTAEAASAAAGIGASLLALAVGYVQQHGTRQLGRVAWAGVRRYPAVAVSAALIASVAGLIALSRKEEPSL